MARFLFFGDNIFPRCLPIFENGGFSVVPAGEELNLFLELLLIPEMGTTKTEFYSDRKKGFREGEGRKEDRRGGKEDGRGGKGREGKGD